MPWYAYLILAWIILSFPVGVLVGKLLRGPVSDEPDLKDFDPVMQFHNQLQVDCPLEECGAVSGELCKDNNGVWIHHDRFLRAEEDEHPLFDVEIGVNEMLPYKLGVFWEEVEIQNDCGYGCKIYQNDKTGRRVLAHNSAYGCRITT